MLCKCHAAISRVLEKMPDLFGGRSLTSVSLYDVQSYSMMDGGEDISENFRLDRITHYVEHPVPIEPPIEEAPAAPMPLMLTQKVCCTLALCIQI